MARPRVWTLFCASRAIINSTSTLAMGLLESHPSAIPLRILNDTTAFVSNPSGSFDWRLDPALATPWLLSDRGRTVARETLA
ncbi:unnamed protein product [Lota lota]